MRHLASTLILFVALSRCSTTTPRANEHNLMAAEAFIDAFYSFDAARLRTALASAQASIPTIGYYQGWAEGGNYRVVQRMPCVARSASEVNCSVTVEDDLIPALGLDMKVTDTFHITFSDDGRITAVRTSSNDPALFNEALQWIQRERPEVLAGPCQGFFDDGPTPRDCVKAVVREFRTFKTTR